MCQLRYLMNIIIKMYITVHSNTKPPGYKGFFPRTTVGTGFLNMGNMLLEAFINISFNYHITIYKNDPSETHLMWFCGGGANAGGTFYTVLINEALLINKQVFK